MSVSDGWMVEGGTPAHPGAVVALSYRTNLCHAGNSSLLLLEHPSGPCLAPGVLGGKVCRAPGGAGGAQLGFPLL